MQLTEAMRLIELAADGPARAHRLGLALSVLASVYAQRCVAERRSLESQLGESVTEESGGSFILAEGLFRRAADLLGAPLVLSGGAQVRVYAQLHNRARGGKLTYKFTATLPPTSEWQSWLRLAPKRGVGQQLSVAVR